MTTALQCAQTDLRCKYHNKECSTMNLIAHALTSVKRALAGREIAPCPGTFVVGSPVPGEHTFYYTGDVPCTGPQVCYRCGARKEE